VKTAEQIYAQGQYAEHNPTWHVEDSPWKAAQVMRVLDLAGAGRGLRICDVGCGAGGVVAGLDDLLSRRGIHAQFTGYDIAGVAVERARNLWKDRTNIGFACLDVLSIDRMDYDYCLLMDVLEHLEDPRGFLVALAAKGIREFIIHLPLENNWLSIMRGRTDPRSSLVGHLHFYDTHSALSLLERAGLEIAAWVYTPELDLDIRLHRTAFNVMAYIPRKVLLTCLPALGAHTLGGAAMMARCRVRTPAND
jgi:SAM-dependent methyltransferase